MRHRRLVAIMVTLAAAAMCAAAAAESVRFEMLAASDERYSRPHDVALDAARRLLVADTGNGRIAVDRVLEGEAYGFDGPRYVDFDGDGRLLVADKYSNRVRVISPDGAMIAVLGTEEAAKGEGVFYHPEGVEIRGNDVWLSDTYNDRIVRYRLTVVP